MIDLKEVIRALRRRHAEDAALDCDPDADISWGENLREPIDSVEFAMEVIFVICNSGMRYTTARKIYDKVFNALMAGESARTVFGHPGKARAINDIWVHRIAYFDRYKAAADKLAYLEALPWIGGITKYHVAKNFGLPYAKPDIHLQRLANALRTTPQTLCEELAKAYQYSVATVDTLLWRAAAVGILDTRTGAVRHRTESTP